MGYGWQIGLFLSLVAQLFFVAQAAILEEAYIEPVEVVIEIPGSGERTIVRGNEITEYYPEAAATPSYSDYADSYPVVTASVRSLTEQEIATLSLPKIGGKHLQFPLAVPAWISSSFGYRIHPISGESRFHQGTDIAAAEGTPVLAAWGGKVEIAGWLGGLGFAVVISHDNGSRETRYGHLSQVLVAPGQTVNQGQAIGLVGSTGFSTGPHLHFELWEKQGDEWVVQNPLPSLTVAMQRLEQYLAQSPRSKA